jgi:hypothetical protein
MAITTSYTWEDGSNVLLNNVFSLGHQSDPAVAGTLAGDGYFAAWTDPNNIYQVEGRIVDAEQVPLGSEFTVNNTANGGTPQYAPSVARLTDGHFVVTYTDLAADPEGDIRARLYTQNGTALGSDFAIDTNNVFDDSDACVAALSGGGFVVTYTRDQGGSNTDIRARVFDQNGGVVSGQIFVDSSAGAQSASSVVGLSSGGFVVVWQQDDNAVYFRRYQSDGTALDPDRVLIDAIGSKNEDIQVVALANGGFAVAFTDTGWNGIDDDITFQIRNADGTALANSIRVNDSNLGGIEAGDQNRPTITTMGDLIVVGWVNEDTGQSYAQVFDAQGDALGDNSFFHGQVAEHELAGLAGGRVANVWQSSDPEAVGLGDSMRSNVAEYVRVHVGDGADDVITGIDDGLHERFFSGGGNDVIKGGGGADEIFGGPGTDTVSYATAPAGVRASLSMPSLNLGDAAGDSYNSIENMVGSAFDDVLFGNSAANILNGGAGDDMLVGGVGIDRIDGGGGDDNAGFALAFNDYIVQDFGARIVVIGPDGVATLSSIEHLVFDDTTITPADLANDGNPLFDTLYYLSTNPDVFQAGVNALEHYNTYGWHEGRDPNPYFDTSGYLAVNPDVAAAGLNPLEHYQQSGWHEGRDPSANFDTALYLINNPDVAAAGIDPLAHYLGWGMTEGRSAYMAIGTVANGFDAQHYLFHNPDVAAAGVDPLWHYNTTGWQEGRDPNGWFDTSGYLAHNGDVAAAGINPLDHYMAVGWTEGRDASAGFDTLGYLAANPDVAAASVNPLQHFLQFGIYEGREPVSDGMWS